MSEKRRDKRKRVLRMGESQNSDGRYRFSYMDQGKRKEVYSWKLEKTDPLPPNKKECIALRELEKRIASENKEEQRKICPPKITVSELVAKYIATQKGIKASTAAGYRTVLNLLEKDEFGKCMITDIKVSDAKIWLISLQDSGKHYSSLHTIRGVLRPAFQMAVEEDLLTKNPWNFGLADVIINDSMRRKALTPKQERQFLDFIKADKHFSRYYDGIFILFKTGLRISEFCGLTLKDIDLRDKTINVNHQLQRLSDMTYHVIEPKTDTGVRKLPMTNEVYEAFQRIIASRPQYEMEPVIDGYGGFLYFDKNHMPMIALHWEKYFEHIVQKYNKIYRIQMPEVTPHVCRHTYCTNMAMSGISPKTLQYLMGHSEIGVTLDVYTHIGFDHAKEEVSAMESAGRSGAAQKSACVTGDAV